MTQQEMSFPTNRPVGDKFLSVKHCIEGSATVTQLHTAYNLRGLWLLGKPAKEDVDRINEIFEVRAAELGYYDWKNSY